MSTASFGELLREARQRKFMTLRGCARLARISPAFLSDIELGRRYPGLAVYKRLLAVLGRGTPGLDSIPRCPACGRRLPKRAMP
jgi:transcriptional regulator with XRE-family HTH domain